MSFNIQLLKSIKWKLWMKIKGSGKFMFTNLSWLETDPQNLCSFWADQWYHRQHFCWPINQTQIAHFSKKIKFRFTSIKVYIVIAHILTDSRRTMTVWLISHMLVMSCHTNGTNTIECMIEKQKVTDLCSIYRRQDIGNKPLRNEWKSCEVVNYIQRYRTLNIHETINVYKYHRRGFVVFSFW